MRLRYLFPLVAAGLLGLAGGAQAAALTAHADAAGNFVLDQYHLTIQPTDGPSTPIYYDMNPTPSQSPSDIGVNIAQMYNVQPASLSYVGGCDTLAGCPGVNLGSNFFSLSGTQPFDYLSIQAGGGELFFHWAQPVTAMTLTILEGFPVALGNYRAYLTTPVPGAFALFLTALGFFGLRRKMAQPQEEQQPLAA